jgi:gluconolactonase
MLFPAPEIIQAEFFSRVPDELRHVENPIHMHGMARTTCIEGPCFDKAGNLYCVDIVYGQIYKFDKSGAASLAAKYDGHPNGLKFDSKGIGYIADSKNGSVRFDPATGKVEPFLTGAFGEPFRGLNDLTFDSKGNLYFTDQGQSGLQRPDGRLYKLGTDGTLQRLLDNIPSPNGLVLNCHEDTLFLAVTRANAVWRVPLRTFTTEAISKVGLFIQLSGGGGPDGLAISEQDHLVVAHVGLGSVWVFDKLGIPLYRIVTNIGTGTTNVAFSGPENKTLFVTETDTGTILKVDLPIAGRRIT